MSLGFDGDLIYERSFPHPRPAKITRLTEGKKLHYKTKFQDLPISIENRRGSIRFKGLDWETKMKAPYGYIPGTKGVDGEALDVFTGPNEDAAFAYIVHQNDPETGDFDEDKVMLGFNSSKQAKKIFLQHYDDSNFFGGIDAIPMWKFRQKIWVKKHTTKRLVASRNGFRESYGFSMKSLVHDTSADTGGQAHVFEGGPGSGPHKGSKVYSPQMQKAIARFKQMTQDQNKSKSDVKPHGSLQDRLKQLYPDGLTVYHEAPAGSSDSIRKKGLIGIGAESGDAVFTRIGEPSNFRSGDKVQVTARIPPKHYERITRDMRYGDEKELLSEHPNLKGADITVDGNIPASWIRSIKDVSSKKESFAEGGPGSGPHGHSATDIVSQHAKEIPKKVWIEKAGGKYMGAMDHPKGGQVHTFKDPKTGTTLAMHSSKINSHFDVKDHMDHSRAKFGQKSSFDPRGMKKEDLPSIKSIHKPPEVADPYTADVVRKQRPGRESRRTREGRIYYARPLSVYESTEEDDDLDFLESEFPGEELIAPRTCESGGDKDMSAYHREVDKADAVVIRPYRMRHGVHRVTAGVFSEAQHALHKGIPVRMLVRGKMHEVKGFKVRSPARASGDFADVILKRRRRRG